MATIQKQLKSSGAPNNFGRRSNPIVSGLGTELAVNPPTIPTVDQVADDKEARRIQALEKTYSAGMGMFMVDLGTALTAGVLGKVFSLFKFKSGTAFVDKWLRSPINALKNTEIGKINQFGLEFSKNAEELVRKAGDDAQADRIAAKIPEKIKAASTSGESLFGGIGKSISKALHAFDDTSIGRAIGKPIRAFANWREGVTANKQNALINNVIGVENKSGLFGIGMKAGTGAAPSATVPRVNTGGIAALRDSTNVSAFDTQIKHLQDTAMGFLHEANTATTKEAAQVARGHYETVRGMAESLQGAKVNMLAKNGHAGFKSASKGLGSALSKLPKLAGRVSIFNAIVGVGIAAGIAASWLTTKRDNKLGKRALRDMAADVYGVSADQVTDDMMFGANAHPLIHEASVMYEKQARGRVISSATYTAGDLLLAGTLRSTGMVSSGKNQNALFDLHSPLLPIMAGQMALPALGQMMIPENQTLNAYAMLKKSEEIGQPLAPSDKMALVQQLMAAVPGIARHSGADNKFAPLIARELVSRNLSSKQIIHTIADPEAMVALSRDIAQKQQEAEEKAKAEHKAKQTEIQRETAAQQADEKATVNQVSAADIVHARPATKVALPAAANATAPSAAALSSVEHQGTIEGQRQQHMA